MLFASFIAIFLEPEGAVRIAIAQINTTVGDVSGNLEKVCAALEQGRRENVELVVFPEQTLPGYPAEDLLESEEFLLRNEEAFEAATKACHGIAMALGVLWRAPPTAGKRVHNSVALVDNRKVIGVQHKALLPTYDVFDEGRYFRPASSHRVFDFRGQKLGLAICEDVWNDGSFWPERRYARDPVEELAGQGMDLLVAISASPFSLGRSRLRYRMLKATVERCRVPLVYANLVGGNTSLVFDGASLAFNAKGDLAAFVRPFEEAFQVLETDTASLQPLPDDSEAAEDEKWTQDDVADGYRALVLGVRDYLGKSGFHKAVIGLSGGIDSALTAVIAAEALGPENVLGVSMPSRYSSEGSLDDARSLAENLGIGYEELPIEKIFHASLETLRPTFADLPENVAEENLQARIRGLLVMALSNKFGSLLLTTGNKSELAVGYCTLYGDMSGGLAVISDVPKTLVYRMAHWCNRKREIVPRSTLEKPPSAELRPDQKDEDSLPPYDVLDEILRAYVENRSSPDEIVAQGFERRTVEEITRLVDRNEYKRKQAAPGLRITTKAFGPGRRFPIVQRFRP